MILDAAALSANGENSKTRRDAQLSAGRDANLKAMALQIAVTSPPNFSARCCAGVCTWRSEASPAAPPALHSGEAAAAALCLEYDGRELCPRMSASDVHAPGSQPRSRKLA